MLRDSTLVALSFLGLLTLGTQARAERVDIHFSAYAAGCDGPPDIMTGVNPAVPVFTADATNSCVVGPLNSSAHAHIFVQPFSEPGTAGTFVLQAQAGTNGLGVADFADVSATEDVTITPPTGSSDTTATVQAADAFDIFISGVTPSTEAEGEFSITLTPVFGNPLFASQTESTNGEFTGTLLTPALTAFGCPCDFMFTINGDASAASGGFADVIDAPFMVLPPGWTYTFSTPAAVPEPTSVSLFGPALAIFGILFRRRKRKIQLAGWK